MPRRQWNAQFGPDDGGFVAAPGEDVQQGLRASHLLVRRAVACPLRLTGRQPTRPFSVRASGRPRPDTPFLNAGPVSGWPRRGLRRTEPCRSARRPVVTKPLSVAWKSVQARGRPGASRAAARTSGATAPDAAAHVSRDATPPGPRPPTSASTRSALPKPRRRAVLDRTDVGPHCPPGSRRLSATGRHHRHSSASGRLRV